MEKYRIWLVAYLVVIIFFALGILIHEIKRKNGSRANEFVNSKKERRESE